MRATLDTETHCFSPGHMAPKVVCLSHVIDGECPTLLDRHEAPAWLADALEQADPIVGHHIAYDLACSLQSYPELGPAIWRAYDEGRVSDTIVRQKLQDLARGKYRGFWTGSKYVVLNYDLAACARRHLKIDIPKDEDTWRKRYAELEDYPLEQWPSEAVDYAILDAVATDGVWLSQQARSVEFGGADLVDESAQCRAAWWLHLTSVHGIVTYASAVERLRQSAEDEIEHLEGVLIAEGLARVERKKGQDVVVRTESAVRARVRECYESDGRPVRMTEGGKALDENGRQKNPPDVCTDRDACLESGDPLLEAYVDYSSARKTLATEVKAYELGAKGTPLHTRFESLAATGRTTSSRPNIQNVRWNVRAKCQSCRRVGQPGKLCDACGGIIVVPPGMRECFVPRPGMVFASADYDGLELRTLAQCCLSLLGHSKLAEALNRGLDAHLVVASQILGRTYDDLQAHIKDDDVQRARQVGKVANFGFPGGLGIKNFVLFARLSYRVHITQSEARALKAAWLKAFPEFAQYFKFIETLGQADGTFLVRHLFSDRLRAGCGYTVACNSHFQGLGSDATKAAGYLIARACYGGAGESDPLFGSRIVNYVHDEFILEVPNDEDDNWTRATAAANRLAELMIEGAAPYLPDVPATTEPLLMTHWSKKAKRITAKRAGTGLLIPWGTAEGEAEMAWQKAQKAA
jgi:DNA polymerase-1